MLPGFPVELYPDEIVAIRHADHRKRCGVDHDVFLDGVVEKEHEGGRRVDLVRRERSWLCGRHRSIDEIPDGRRVRHQAPLDFHRLGIAQRYEAAMQWRSGAVRAM